MAEYLTYHDLTWLEIEEQDKPKPGTVIICNSGLIGTSLVVGRVGTVSTGGRYEDIEELGLFWDYSDAKVFAKGLRDVW